MLIDLTGRTALVTGASSGLGKAVAARLAASGARVAVLARGEDALAAAADAIRAEAKGEVLPIPCDITDPAQRDAAMGQATDRFGAVDILVNNAGSSRRGEVETLTRDGVVEDLDLKLLAPLALIQAVVPTMKERRWGRIVNVSAVVGKAPDGGSMPTSLSRAAGLSMTRTLSRELAPWNILVNALCVGKIKSGQWERRYEASGKAQSYEEFLAPVAKTIPLGRMGEAEEFANAACFLVSDQASYITGAAINVDGGLCPVA
ncbi:SDR family oxidoreductase [Roseitranquillus sediminis]|uniref:SDR family oxidoreductase n=1 Tax=Roseitranquillus sediminis TaxID=2809051 RepID=UPI001D0C1FA3|nr:SDR family oxidoreductase [Roseitranquillus sediminis]MBM9592993.1 SDR family oxidoreductase [Roseitranquillus sediminis]